MRKRRKEQSMYDDKWQEDQNPSPKRRVGFTPALLGLELTGLIVAVVLIGLIAGSCGKEHDEVAAVPTTQPAAETASAVVTVASHTPPQSPERDDALSPDSLPPEVIASVSDTLVTPGSVIEISAEASVDATDLSLWDGFGKRQPLTYDEAGKVWRTIYRVPLKSADRLGLSVTAKNGTGRWRRVWVFLHADRGTSVPADSTQ
jgi:hypothetical protein